MDPIHERNQLIILRAVGRAIARAAHAADAYVGVLASNAYAVRGGARAIQCALTGLRSPALPGRRRRLRGGTHALVSPPLAEKLGRPRTVKAGARVRVQGELRAVGDVAAWRDASRNALEPWRARTWKPDERFTLTIGPDRISVEGELRGATYLFEGEALAKALAAQADAEVTVTGEVVLIEPASGIGLRVIAAGTRGVRVERIGPG